jgi:hypothetical protein
MVSGLAFNATTDGTFAGASASAGSGRGPVTLGPYWRVQAFLQVQVQELVQVLLRDGQVVARLVRPTHVADILAALDAAKNAATNSA